MMSAWLFHVYMDGVVREMNARVFRKGLEQLSVKVCDKTALISR